AGDDTTVLVWDLPCPARVAPPPQLSRPELDALWADLGGDGAGAAIAALVAAPGLAAECLRERLRPVPEPPPGLIARLLTDLESERFAVREQATQELARYAELAEPELVKKRDSRPALEVR